jgi:hypothetical protein
MDLWNIVKKVGAGAISALVPGGSKIVSLMNAVLPKDKQLPEDATGEQAQNALASLPAADRASLMDKQFDVDIVDIKESHDSLRTMLESEAKSTHTTRPKIAYQSFQVIAYVAIAVVTGWLYTVVTDNDVMMTAITDGWPFVAAVILPFVGFLDRYFGKLRQESKDRLDAAGGVTPQSRLNIGSAIKSLVGK